MRRVVEEESGVALGLAVIVVVLVGVLATGLLTLVSTNLDATVEANRGRQAFEMTEAGVEVAKARLADDPGLTHWSSGELVMDGIEESTVVVAVERDGASFEVISVGESGGARRVVEATFSVADGEPRLLSWRECYNVDCG